MPTQNLFNNFTHLFNSMDKTCENLCWVPLAPSSQVLASEDSKCEELSLSWVDKSMASCSIQERTDHCLGTVDEDTRALFEGSVLSTKLAMGLIVWAFRTSVARILIQSDRFILCVSEQWKLGTGTKCYILIVNSPPQDISSELYEFPRLEYSWELALKAFLTYVDCYI